MNDIKLYTVDEVCENLRIGRTRLYELIDTGAIKPIKIGKLTRFTHDELVAFIGNAVEVA